MRIKKIIRKLRIKEGYLTGLLTGILVAVLGLKLIPTLIVKTNINLPILTIASRLPTPTIDSAKQQEEVVKAVLPERVDLGVKLGDSLIKMIQSGVIDKEKFTQLYESRGGLTSEEKKLLEQPSDDNLVINQTNANLILNILWPLGIANKTSVLAGGPIGKEYKAQVGNFASTGGWSLGKEDGGKLFNRFSIVSLTPEQETKVKEIAENIYRPCCGNSTYFPDCNHGAAMLGFIELAVAQGMREEKIYKKALALNSYWFPQTYVELAVYFKAKKSTSWERIDSKEVLGVNYSSGQGYRAVNQELQTLGLLPKVEGGGGCSV